MHKQTASSSPNRWGSAAAYAVGIVLLLAAFRLSAAYYAPFAPLDSRVSQWQIDHAAFFQACGREDQALELARLAVATDPESADARFALGRIYDSQDKILEAMAEYREAIRRRPEMVNSRVNLGILLGRMGQLESAAEQFRAAGDDPDALYNLEITERALEQIRRQRGR